MPSVAVVRAIPAAREARAGIRITSQPRWWLSIIVLMAAAALSVGSARAAVDLRVEAPLGSPIEAFVTVTTAAGDPVSGLTVDDFTLTLDGQVIDNADVTFSLPPSEDPNQRVSVAFVMDFSASVRHAALQPMRQAVIDFINEMNVGDYAAVIKFNGTQGASVRQSFLDIDDGVNDQMLIDAVNADYDGSGSNVLDATDLGVSEIRDNSVLGLLPPGPKVVILVSDGQENDSSVTQEAVVANANSGAGGSIPIFTVGVGDVAEGVELMTSLAEQTGGEYLPAPTDAEIEQAYATIKSLLDDSYLLTFDSTIADCNLHMLRVNVAGRGSDTEGFRRCDLVLSVTLAGAGAGTVTSDLAGIDCGVDCSESYDEGTIVTLTADPAAGSTFTGWNGGACTGTGPCEVTVTDDIPVTATFAPASGGGGGGGSFGLIELLAVLTSFGIARTRRHSPSVRAGR
jgi:VWFA-related protein